MSSVGATTDAENALKYFFFGGGRFSFKLLGKYKYPKKFQHACGDLKIKYAVGNIKIKERKILVES